MSVCLSVCMCVHMCMCIAVCRLLFVHVFVCVTVDTQKYVMVISQSERITINNNQVLPLNIYIYIYPVYYQILNTI